MQSKLLALFVALVCATPALAAQAQVFQPPASSPESASGNYTGQSNGTISNGPLVSGKAFDRFIQIWLENTDFATAASSPVFQNLSKEGILLDSFYAVTHPSEPNYLAAVAGDFWGLADDAFYHAPQNISTIVDLLDQGNVSWASYQENMPSDGFTGFNYTQADYITGHDTYTYYVRKHNGLIIHDSVANVSSRAHRIRNFNDFAADLKADVIPQWVFVTPNLVNDAHDTTIDFTGDWLNYWLVPLLGEAAFNDNRTLILLTFDENETYTVNNRIYTLVLGGGVPAHLRGTTDSTYYTHYSALSTVEANWELMSLGRGDTNATLNNVLAFVANATGWTNNGLAANASGIPLTNLTGDIPGPLNSQFYLPFPAPNVNGKGAGGKGVFVAAGLNPSATADTLGAPVNLTALGQTNPWSGNGGIDYTNTSAGPATTSKASGAAVTVGMRAELLVVMAGVVLGGVMVL
ncbi:phosphoesterase family-domain-containing protein [Epithele typhae]|uniref:phosphoesterase family-domain-containing protein n=1 Tax=Epithele typhae TaxID=378194 RepID=UPI002008AF00|nr:phosphoesterase family-domain-containing protein [Epithele typhae]KAH9927904.1 phosphoesterase family-domain-containing protein [Epithele typhae]